MATLKITKKHHKRLNNPCPSTPPSLPLIQGTLFFNPHTIPSNQIFALGTDFQLLWTTTNGGHLSVCHHSQPTRTLWSTVPGQAFVSAAVVETEVEESRGSFVISDRNVILVCDHQTVDDIRVIHTDFDFDLKNNLNDIKFPVLLITGKLFSRTDTKCKDQSSARYWVVLDQKNSNQIGFQVRVEQLKFEFNPTRLGKYQRLRRKLRRIRKRRLEWFWFCTRPRGFAGVSSLEETEMKASQLTEVNRICLSYSSEADESFYGFGEQFSSMNFKGKRVPILVQEQGIGRGDQPITFAANLVSFRAGGDWSTTYAPSPFYMTSKMRSLYLEGYDYSIFDLTRHDRVQIQIHSNSAQGRIINGNSPSELIERYTETIGRPPELPKWIISGAVVGMQGGTEVVRRIWDELKTYKVPISAFWLQVTPYTV